MLKRAWYLADTDYWSDLPQSPRLPQTPTLIAELNTLFGDDAGFSTAHTTTAVEVMLRMAEHLSNAVPHAKVTLADTTQTARLLLGFDLLSAHLAQIAQALAYQAGSGTGADLSDLPLPARAALTGALATASCRLEEAASLFKEAHVAAVNDGPRQVKR